MSVAKPNESLPYSRYIFKEESPVFCSSDEIMLGRRSEDVLLPPLAMGVVP